MALKVPDSPSPNTTIYKDLKGVDFSQDASLIDTKHSPDMLNMISDEGGNPVKRKGWEELINTNDFDFDEEVTSVKIHKLWNYTINNTEKIFVVTKYTYEGGQPVHTITNYKVFLASVQNDGTLGAFTAIHNDDVTIAYYFRHPRGTEYFYFFPTGRYSFYRLDKFDGVEQVSPYVPTIIISKSPDGSGGTAYEDFNMFGNMVSETFLVTGQAADTFKLAKKTSLYSLNHNLKISVLQNSGDWEDYTGTISFPSSADVTSDTLKLSPAIPVTPSDGTPNVKITYELDDGIVRPFDYTQCIKYAKGTMDNVWITGHYLYPNRVWYSAIGDPTYFPDINYIDVGADDGKIMGLLPVQGELAVIKSEPKSSNSSIYLIYDTSISSTAISATESGETKTTTEQIYTYAVKRVATAVGAVSKDGFGILGDEPLFLSKKGLYGITSLNTTEDKAVTNRSRSADGKMTAEDLTNAQVITHNNYLYVFANNHVYVFDGRNKSADRRNNTPYYYEAYYWDNVPAKKVCVVNDNLYFINDNQLCRFKNRGDLTDYSDGSTIVDGEVTGGEPIHARWSTKNDDDNAPQMFKTMLKKGSMCTLAQYDRSSVDVWARLDGKIYVDENGNEVQGDYIGRFYADTWTGFDNIDFDRFTFDTHDGPRDYFFRKKKKKYIRLQLIFENNELNEGFGIHQVVKSYTATRYAK